MDVLRCLVRRLLGCCLALVAWCGTPQKGAAQDDLFYYRKGEKIALKVDASKSYVLFSPTTTKTEVEKATKPVGAVIQRFDVVKVPTGLNLTQDTTAEAKWAIIDNNDISAKPLTSPEIAKNVLYKAPFFLTKDKKQVGMSHLVYVKLKDPADKSKLELLAKKLKIEIVGNNKQMPLWYTLACTKDSIGNALVVANALYESKAFVTAEPDFLADFRIKGDKGKAQPPCADDALFEKQWGLKNTGQHGGIVGTDINICEAWKVTTGKGVTVAVVDHGIQLDHPDLKANILPLSFDTVTGTSPSQIRGSHGTACAGIIAGIRSNGQLGVAGVAPEAKLMSISDNLMLGPDAQQNLASGLSWAWQKGADVISNSWGHDLLESALIDDAIEDALTKGRGGKGCVVVFAAGNSNNPVIYPARSNPAVLAVAAMSPCGERVSLFSCVSEGWGSCFGSQLDIAAPGIKIPTTDRTGSLGYDTGDYTLTFNGTSSATPHVAGVAALILQLNPNLKQDRVVEIIEKSGRKVGQYTYQTVSGRPNGGYHEEMGYGLVDAKVCADLALKSLAKKK